MILFSHKCGQLGNRLFTFAHLIANAAENNVTVCNLSFDEYAPHFEKTRLDLICRYPARRTFITSRRLRSMLFLLNKVVLKACRTSGFFSSLLHSIVIADLPEFKFGGGRYFELRSQDFQDIIKKKPMVFLFGRFFRDHANFERHQELLRSFFRPTTEIETNVFKFLLQAKSHGDLIIGVHMRLGDYREYAGGKYFFTQENYFKKMEGLRDTLPQKKIVFIICSNEKIELRDFKGLNVFAGSGHIAEDMYTLAGCDLIMGPPSTYSAWASFYGNKPIYRLENIDRTIALADFQILPLHLHYNI